VGDLLRSKATGLLLAAVLIASLGGAGYQWLLSTPARPELEQIPQPNMEDAEPVTRDHIREALEQTLQRADAKAYGTMGQIYQSYNYFDAAAACYRNAIALDPGEYRWPHLLSLVLTDDGEAEGALAAAEQALQALRQSRGADPVESRAVRYQLAILHLRSGNAAAAEQLLAPLSEADGTGAVWYALGQLAAQVDRGDAAVQAYRRAVELAPESRPALNALGAELLRLGEREEGRRYLAQARGARDAPPRAVDPMRAAVAELNQSAASLNRRAAAASRAGNYKRALTLYRRAVEAEPKHRTARINLAVTMDRLGLRHQAKAELKRALSDHPESAAGHLAMGRLQAKSGEFKAALESLARSRELNPANASAALWEASVTGLGVDVSAGLRKFDLALERFPGDATLTRGKARLLAFAGRRREAADLLSRFLQSAPDCAGCRHYLARLWAAAPEASLRDGTKALQVARELVASARDVARTETLAMALAETGDFEAAQQEQRKALRQARRAERDDLLERVEGRLTLYQAGRPCREPWDRTETFPLGIAVP